MRCETRLRLELHGTMIVRCIKKIIYFINNIMHIYKSRQENNITEEKTTHGNMLMLKSAHKHLI